MVENLSEHFFKNRPLKISKVSRKFHEILLLHFMNPITQSWYATSIPQCHMCAIQYIALSDIPPAKKKFAHP